jgi:hypothetical protein
VLGVVVFLVTGQLMRHHEPPMAALSEGVRLMHRSRHIYILSSGLVNLMLGLYLQEPMAGWRGATQTVGSFLLLASPVLLTVAFAVEGARGFQPELVWSHLGLYALFGGCMAHAASSIGVPRN